jgi:hypothetical protein
MGERNATRKPGVGSQEAGGRKNKERRSDNERTTPKLMVDTALAAFLVFAALADEFRQGAIFEVCREVTEELPKGEPSPDAWLLRKTNE